METHYLPLGAYNWHLAVNSPVPPPLPSFPHPSTPLRLMFWMHFRVADISTLHL